MNEPYLLPEDREAAEVRIAELERHIQELGEDFRDAFSQSSETWHDNSPFEAVRDKQSMYAAELHQLRTLLRSSTLIPPKRRRGCVGIGSIVTLQEGRVYKIAGDWTHQVGKHADGMWYVSSLAPVAQALIGKKVGDEVTVGALRTLIATIRD